jgi:nicotinate phosphoribosyltransferase
VTSHSEQLCKAGADSIRPGGGALALLTDLYELKMLQAYFEEGMSERAVFSLFVRRLPPERNYLLACGLAPVLDYLENLSFCEEDIAYLASLGSFSDRFLRYLRGFRFTGEVHAVPEGTPVFANEPILEVVAPIGEGQLIETLVMNQVHHQTLIATKAARMVQAAKGRAVVDFGARRMHGIDAALKAVRACWIGGVAATSNVLGARTYGVPASGTMAHSYIQAHDDEETAFRRFAALYPETVLLVDTYDTLDGVRRVIDLARRLGDEFVVQAVRLDSGDLAALSKSARALLDAAGLQEVQIFASGGLDEYRISELVAADAPIDAFGIGTALGVSSDRPDLDIVYKLAEYAGKGRLKLSAGKPILPGRKQVFRIEEDGAVVRDVIAGAEEDLPGRPLLAPVMRAGRRLVPGGAALDDARARARQELDRLPPDIAAVTPAAVPFGAEPSETLKRAQRDLAAHLQGSRGHA